MFADAAEWVLRHVPPRMDAEDLAALAEPVSTASALRSVLAFRVRGDWLALDVAAVQEIAPAAVPHAIPHLTGAGIAGLVNVQGQLMLAADLGWLIAQGRAVQDPEPGVRPRIVVVRLCDDVWAFVADDVPGVVALPLDTAMEAPATLKPPLDSLARGLVAWEERYLVVIDPDRLRGCLDGLLAAAGKPA
ncbi:MAG: chemotaxis protein CheW [Rubrivivax sp.]